MSSGKFKVVITDSYHPTLDAEREEIQEINADLILEQTKGDEDAIMAATKDADGLIVQHAQITRRVIENLEKCRIIARYGVGFDNVDTVAATERGIMVSNVPDYCIDEVSSHAIALLMQCCRKIVLLSNTIKAGRWTYKIAEPVYKLMGQNLGIVGLGRIGSAAARKGLGLGLNVQAYDPYLSETDLDVEFVDFDRLLQTSDFISLHAPLTDETYHMFGENEFRKMKKSAFLINTARGPVVDGPALCEALETGEIAGAGVDVMEPEPIPQDDPLLKLENFIITPHIAWYSEESQKLLQRETARAVVAVLKGGKPRSLVNPEVMNVKK
ncbi:C-terminal binding protein [Candidatus Poribacteria bacterium]